MLCPYEMLLICEPNNKPQSKVEILQGFYLKLAPSVVVMKLFPWKKNILYIIIIIV